MEFWIAADLLAQAHARGVRLAPDFESRLRDVVWEAQRRALVAEREDAAQRRRDAQRRERWRAGGWRF